MPIETQDGLAKDEETGFHWRAGTQDGQVIREVINRNCYMLPPEMDPFPPVIDVGANIGAFALACLHRGASRIICYEPEAENFSLLRRNMEACKAALGAQVSLYQLAVWGGKEGYALQKGAEGMTAMHHMAPRRDGQANTPSVTLAEILERHDEIQLLKLDCEGGEWAALHMTPERLLRRCRSIVAELHLGYKSQGLDCTPWGVYKRLRVAAFDVMMAPSKEPDYVWTVWAQR